MTADYDGFVRDRLPAPERQPLFLFDLPALHYPERLNAAVELIDRAVDDGDGERIAIVGDDECWSYARLKDASDRIARLLREEEALVPGNRVLLRGPNGAMLHAAWLGVLKAGGIAVTTMPLLRAGEITTILERGAISHAIVAHGVREDFDLAAAQAPVRSLLTYGGGDEESLETRLRSVAPGFVPYPSGRDDPALIAFTSGTTGRPKGCIQYHRDILAVADAFAAQVLKPSRGDVFLTSAPIAFTFGLGASLIFPLRFRATSVTLERPTPAALLDALERHRVTTLFTAPTAYKEILDNLPGRDLSRLRSCVSAGEHLPQTVSTKWHEATGIRIIDGIGATEMMHIFISASGDDIRPGATGKAVPGYVACVLDGQGHPAHEGIGRLAVRGPTGCRYLDDPRQDDYVHRGWNVTGDIYRIDGEGYFWYVARSDDMIISSGYNIAAPEVENALLSHPAVSECAVIGVPSPDRGQKVKAFVVVRERAGDELAKELQGHVKRVIAPYKYPREIEFVDVLPRTATGKLQRFALRAG